MSEDNIMGERIKSLRQANGMTQAELADKLGVQFTAVNKWEHGTVRNIKQSTIKKMSEIFDVSPVYLMGLTNDNNVGGSTKHVASFSCGSGLIAPTLINGSVSGGAVSMNNPITEKVPSVPVKEETNVPAEDTKLSPEEKTYILEVLARLDVHQLQRIRNHINSLIDLKQ